MTLRYILITGVIFFGLTLNSCGSKKQFGANKQYWTDTAHLSNEEIEQRRVWMNFRQAILSRNLDKFRKLSLSCIYCPDCDAYLLNPQVDTAEITKYISTETFINDAFQPVFNKSAINFYFNEANIGWIRVTDDSDIALNSYFNIPKMLVCKKLEVGIKDDNCKGDECSQTIFYIYRFRNWI